MPVLNVHSWNSYTRDDKKITSRFEILLDGLNKTENLFFSILFENWIWNRVERKRNYIFYNWIFWCEQLLWFVFCYSQRRFFCKFSDLFWTAFRNEKEIVAFNLQTDILVYNIEELTSCRLFQSRKLTNWKGEFQL